MGLPANPWDCCQPLGYSKAKFQCGLLCQNHMMSVLFSPDQNNQSFRLLQVASVSLAAGTSLVEVAHTSRHRSFAPQPRGLGPPARGQLTQGSGSSDPSPAQAFCVPNSSPRPGITQAHWTGYTYRSKQTGPTFINNQLSRKTTENEPWLSFLFHY